MPKTAEETLLELDKIAAQSRRDAEIVRAYIEAKKAYQEVQARINGSRKASKILTINMGESHSQPAAKKAIGGTKRARGRKSSNDNIVLRRIIDVVREADRFVKYAQVRGIATEFRYLYPKRTDEWLDKLVRNVLYRDRNSANPALIHIAEPLKEGKTKAVYTYGLPEFLDANKQPLRKHLPID